MKLTNDPQAWRVALGLAVAGLLLFGASFNDPFHFDDSLILNDSNVANAERWPHFLNPLHLRQVTFFTFYLNHQITGPGPAGYHIVNVVLHTANAVLLFLLLNWFVERWVAIAAAAVFLVHPIQTESVLYVYQRSILLACFFSLLAVMALAKRRHWLAVLLFVLAFESKESAIAVPLVLGLLRFEGLASKSRRRLLLGTALVLAIAALGLLAYWGEKTVGFHAAAEIHPVRYLWTETRVVFTYLRLLVFPIRQSLEYEFSGSPGLLPALGLIGILAGALWLSRQRGQWQLPALCILAFFILLAPTSSIVPSADVAFEHRLYLPMLAFSLLAGLIAARLPLRTWLGSAVLVILGALTLLRGNVWSSDIRLWEDTVQQAPGKSRAWFNLGGAYLNSDPEKARSAFLRALELDPGRVEALYDLGLIEQRKGNYEQALDYYRKASAKDPNYWPAWNNMGNTLFSMGQRERSIEYFERTLRLNRDYWPAQYNVAIVHFLSGRYLEAMLRLKTVLDWQPHFREARYLLALSASRTGNTRLAEEEMKKLGPITAAELSGVPSIIQKEAVKE